MTVRPRTIRLLPLLSLALAGGCLGVPSGDSVPQGELLIELSDAINTLRSEDAVLQEQIDSLRAIVARQDSVIARLGAATGVPVQP